MQEMQVQSLGQEDPLGRKWQPAPVFFPGKFHRQRCLEGYSPWSGKQSNITEHTCTHMQTDGQTDRQIQKNMVSLLHDVGLIQQIVLMPLALLIQMSGIFICCQLEHQTILPQRQISYTWFCQVLLDKLIVSGQLAVNQNPGIKCGYKFIRLIVPTCYFLLLLL